MSLRPLAAWIMRRASALAPASRAEWTAAMTGEFDAVETDRQAFNWAAGCLATSLGWWIGANAVYLLGLGAAALWLRSVSYIWMYIYLPFEGRDLFRMALWAYVFTPSILALPALLLGFHKPAWAWITALAVILLQDGLDYSLFHFFPVFASGPLWSSEGNQPHVPGIVLDALFLSGLFLPPVVGALLGSWIGRRVRRTA